MISDAIKLSTRGFNDMKDITDLVAQRLEASKLKDGLVNLFVPGSTGGLMTIEFESGLVEDFSKLMERIIPSNVPYGHNQRWGDGNGFSHVRASLLGASLTVPFSSGKLNLGTWQQIVFVDFDNRPRSRTILIQFLGE